MILYCIVLSCVVLCCIVYCMHCIKGNSSETRLAKTKIFGETLNRRLPAISVVVGAQFGSFASYTIYVTSSFICVWPACNRGRLPEFVFLPRLKIKQNDNRKTKQNKKQTNATGHFGSSLC